MKLPVALCLFLSLALYVEAWSKDTCMKDKNMCKPHECCVMLGPVPQPFGRCRPYRTEGEWCELKPLKNKLFKHVYVTMCPCAEGLSCEKGNSGLKLAGKCVKL